MKRRYSAVPIVALAFALAQVTKAEPPAPTALNLVNKGDNYVGIQCRDKIVRLTSDKSVGSLTPNVWHVEFYDPDAPLKSVEVKFGGGQEMDVSHPTFQLPANGNDIIDKARLRVDSDRALNIAIAQPYLKGLTLRASKLTLSRENGVPQWKVQLWASRASDGKEVDIGSVSLSATDGTVLKSDLKPEKAQ